MKRLRRTRRGGFSLLEVVIVVAIIAILAAIGIPRMSRGSKGAGDSALSGDLAVLRNAIDLYAAEHGGRPRRASTVRTFVACPPCRWVPRKDKTKFRI